MLSYQHAYHAGNIADVLKHAVLCSVIDYMVQKDKPFYFHDTHAGRGLYPFSLKEMQKTREHEQGIQKLWPVLLAGNYPASLKPYVTALRDFNTNDNITRYPGSGLFAHTLMRSDDRLMLTELHPGEFTSLRENTRALDNVTVQKTDAWAGLRAALPPLEKRGAILIDPSYELKNEHQQVIDAMREALTRFATGVYLIWYPLISGDDPAQALLPKKLLRGIQQLDPASLLRLELCVARSETRSGLYGSGMLVINAPWQLDKAMKEALPFLHKQLAEEAQAEWRVQWIIEKH